MDIKKQLSEYQVEYNVLQEEISTTQHYLESLNREKENSTHLENKLQVCHASTYSIPTNSNLEMFFFTIVC